MRNKILIYVLICAIAIIFTSCAKEGTAAKTETGTSKIQAVLNSTESHNTETEALFGIDSVYEARMLGFYENDGKETNAAEALRSAMKGTRSVLELTKDERIFGLGGLSGTQYVEEVKDMPDSGLAGINLLEYNSNYALSLMSKTEWVCFLCADLNQDGTKEVLLVGNGARAVLHYAGDEVYMTVMPPGLFPSEVYENGVCINREWSSWSLCYDMYYPAKGAMYLKRIAYSDEGRYAETGSDIYEIDSKRVTREEYYAYVEQLVGGLTPLEWYDFTEENIDRYVID